MYMVLWKSSPTMGDRRREGKPAAAPTSRREDTLPTLKLGPILPGTSQTVQQGPPYVVS